MARWLSKIRWRIDPNMTRIGLNKTEDSKAVCCLFNVCKSFGAVQALHHVSLEIRRGETLAIVGENGAGKTTLMNILFGLMAPDEGSISLDGQEVVFKNAAQAIDAGIGMVHQHFMLYPNLTVLENILIGAEGKTRFGLLDFEKRRTEILALIDEFEFKLAVDKKVSELSLDAQQQLEIIKILYRGSQIIILDEPTAILIPKEIEALFNVIKRLTDEGKSVIIVTHKLGEVMENADRVVVMRSGEVVDTLLISQTSQAELAKLMVGREIEPLKKIAFIKDDVVLEVNGLTVQGTGKVAMLDNISLQIKSGEILGIAGVSGSGQKQLVEALVGLRNPDGGEILLDGVNVNSKSVRQRRDVGLAYIAEDRMMVGLAVDASVAENAIAGREASGQFTKYGLFNFQKIREFTRDLIERFDIRTTGSAQIVDDLSGGNKQKIIVARELNGSPRLIIAENPCWGVDIGAISFIQRQLLDCAKDGAAVLLISTELEELFDLSDRLSVFYEGRISATFTRAELDIGRVGEAMAGGEAA